LKNAATCLDNRQQFISTRINVDMAQAFGVKVFRMLFNVENRQLNIAQRERDLDQHLVRTDALKAQDTGAKV